MRFIDWHLMMMTMSRVILVTLLISIAVAGRLKSETASGTDLRHSLFFETGGLLGGETKVPMYEESFFRLYSEAGYEFETSRDEKRRGNRYGLAVSGALGSGDMRIGISPRITWQFHPRWAIQGAAGPVWSSKEEEAGLFERGWQVRGGLLYEDLTSFTVLWQALPYSINFEGYESGTQHSVYAGVMFHGMPGVIVSLVTWGIIAAVVGFVLITHPPS